MAAPKLDRQCLSIPSRKMPSFIYINLFLSQKVENFVFFPNYATQRSSLLMVPTSKNIRYFHLPARITFFPIPVGTLESIICYFPQICLFPGFISLLFGLFEREGPAHRSCFSHGWARFSFSVIWSKPSNSSTLRPHLRDQKFRLTKIPLTFDHRPLTKWVWVFQWHRSWWRCLWNGGTWNLDQEKLVLTCFFF